MRVRCEDELADNSNLAAADEFQHGQVSKRQFTTAFPNKVKPLKSVKE